MKDDIIYHTPPLPNRQSIRYKGYDYRGVGYYHVTICCFEKKCRFGKVIDDKVVLNEFGQIAFDIWESLPDRFERIETDVYVIMPNHIHGIIIKKENEVREYIDNVTKRLGDIVGAFKSIVFNECLKIYKARNLMMGKLWQDNYWERIIRNEDAYFEIGNYIINNPRTWSEDKLFVNGA